MLRIRVEIISNTTVIHCAGRIVLGEETATLHDAIARHSANRIIFLDLAEVQRIDAAGLGTLVGIREWARAGGRSLKLMNVTEHVERLLTLTNLSSLFEICSVAEMLWLCFMKTESSLVAAAKSLGRDLQYN